METHVGKLTASRRTNVGKIEVRKLRHRGLIPAVVYGGESGSQALTVDPNELYAALDPQKKRNTLIEMTLESAGEPSEQLNVMLRDHQVDPLSRDLLHADFIRVVLDKLLRAQVPLELIGRPKGVQLGGLLNQVFRTLPVECTPDKIPPRIEIDVTELDIGDSLQISSLSWPEGVRSILPPEQTVALVVESRGAAEDEETPEEEEEAAEGETAEAAPASA